MTRVKSTAAHFLLLAMVYLLVTDVSAAAGSQPTDGQKPSVAVLPYANMSGEVENENLSVSLWIKTIDSLAKVPSLRVASRSSSQRFKDSDDGIQTIGESLGVSYVLEGSVGRFDSLVRVMVQLIRVDDETNVWAVSYDRDVASAEVIPRDIADSVARVVRQY